MSILLLGFLIGLKHALEADHVAAVAALACRSHNHREAIRLGTVWGLGHTLSLFIIGSMVVVLDAAVPERFARILELGVGVMLVGLGVDVIRRMVRDRVHYHVHSHDDGVEHFHAHKHTRTGEHTEDAHQHTHHSGFPYRALLVGLVHGMAGSAALILLTLANVDSVARALLYMLLFGIGSIAGMAALSAVIVVPLRASARGLTWMHNGLQAALGVVTVALGALLVHETLSVV